MAVRRVRETPRPAEVAAEQAQKRLTVAPTAARGRSFVVKCSPVKHALDYSPPERRSAARRVVFWWLFSAAALLLLVWSIRTARLSPPMPATLTPLPAATVPSTQTIAPATQAQLQSFFYLLRTQDIAPAVFSGPTTQPGTPPQ
jgi:hypothetical protein